MNFKVIGTTAVVLLLVALVVYFVFIKKIFEKGEETGRDILIPTGCRSGFNADSEAVAVHDGLAENDWRDDLKIANFNRILGWNGCELASVHNKYKDKYAKTDFPTLRRLIQAENIFWGGRYAEALKLKEQVLARLTELGI